MPLDPSRGESNELFGLSGLRARPPERFPIRTRSSSVTHSAWRLQAECDQGTGAIVLVESGPKEKHYRGEGIFLGWPQERLAAAYASLLPPDDEPPFEVPQLG